MAWSWKDKDREINDQLNLLYEPGNWGDLLKHLWAFELSRSILKSGLESIRLFDPFSGAESYPLTSATADRVAALPETLAHTLKPLCRERFPSTGSVFAGQFVSLDFACLICEQDQARRSTWTDLATFVEGTPIDRLKTYLKPNSGFSPNLVLWDPYDFFEQWSHAIPFLLQVARRADVLIYFLNKSPQAVGKLKNYQAMKARLDQKLLIGRVPADSLLPRSYHELWLMGPRAHDVDLAKSLARTTQLLNQHISNLSCFELYIEQSAC